MGLRLLITAFFCVSTAFAAEVQNLSEDRLVLIVGQPSGEPWQLNESACVFRHTQRIACGYIEQQNETGGRVVLTSTSGVGVQMGDFVERVQFTSNVFRVNTREKTLAVTHEANHHWVEGDTACFARDGKIFACGLVSHSEPLNAEIHIYETDAKMAKVGDEVRRIGGKVAVLTVGNSEATAEQAKAMPWKIGQAVGIYRNGAPIASGRISASEKIGARIELGAAFDIPVVGDVVLPLGAGTPGDPERQTAAATPMPAAVVQTEQPVKPPGSMLFSVGLFSLGSSVRFLRFEKRIAERYRLGSINYVVGGHASSPTGYTSDMKGFGSLVTGSYQPFESPYRGLTFLAGLGVMSLETNVAGGPERKTGPAFLFGVGWRWTWASGFSLALNANEVMVLASGAPNLPGSLPHFSFELGVHF